LFALVAHQVWFWRFTHKPIGALIVWLALDSANLGHFVLAKSARELGSAVTAFALARPAVLALEVTTRRVDLERAGMNLMTGYLGYLWLLMVI
jgi:hypothetical protein